MKRPEYEELLLVFNETTCLLRTMIRLIEKYNELHPHWLQTFFEGRLRKPLSLKLRFHINWRSYKGDSLNSVPNTQTPRYTHSTSR
jgi:hypothetical protein